MRSHVRDHVTKCEFCQRAKPPSNTRVGLYSAGTDSRPMQRLFIDFVGPLVRTRNGNKMGFNSAYHEATKSTFAEVFLGRSLNHPLQLQWKLKLEEPMSQTELEAQWRYAIRNLCEANRKTAVRYNAARQPHKFLMGDRVMSDIIVGSACTEDLMSWHSSDIGRAAERILGTPGFYSAILEPLHISTCEPSRMFSGDSYNWIHTTSGIPAYQSCLMWSCINSNRWFMGTTTGGMPLRTPIPEQRASDFGVTGVPPGVAAECSQEVPESDPGLN
ncbi:hypothetical protein ANN_24717 [Periplaneta americana]|uniref:Uncharacterized protein n=1 Tax=Periplaneta americana TaxID=6978 RepID=A0ABQ8RZM1_PERAM|nr:hypothetical protein ANN_24717 [Periplaneta americana]